MIGFDFNEKLGCPKFVEKPVVTGSDRITQTAFFFNKKEWNETGAAWCKIVILI